MIRVTEQHEKLARICHADCPNTAIERWRAACIASLIGALLAKGRDVTILVGRSTDRKCGDLGVVLDEERN